MIPKIITINETTDIDGVINKFASEYSIPSSHRVVVLPEKEELTVEQVHAMQKDIIVLFDQTVLIVLVGVDNSSSEVQNSLLKCLEEESERIQFLFLVKNASRLLPTILSRCSTVSLGLNQIHLVRSKKNAADLFSFESNSDSTKEKALTLIDEYIQTATPIDMQTTKHLLTMRKLIIDNNVNPVLALDNILIFLSKNSTMKVQNEK